MLDEEPCPHEPGTPLPDEDHVLRYIRKKHVDNGIVCGAGFMRRPTEDTPPSVNWMECFTPPIVNQIEEISARRRIKYEKRGKLVRINVGHTKRYVAENVTLSSAETPILFVLAFLHDPLRAEKEQPADPSHALIDGIPVERTPDAELIQDLLVDCILDQFDVVPD
jgi:hypothetical protein